MNYKDKTIKYIGFYDSIKYKDESRNYVLAATNKMDYIASALVKAGYTVQLISPSWTSKNKGWISGRKSIISDNISLTVGPTFGAENWLMRKFRIIFSWLWLFFYLIFNVKRGEKVLAYHSLMLDFPLYCAKLIKRFKLVLEVEEEYCVVIKQNIFFEWLEKKIISCADYHLLPTDLMSEAYAPMNKKNVIIYGNYTEYNTKEKKEKDKILIVYAGIIDLVKAGAFNAVKTAKYLDDRFHIKIIGFGKETDIKRLEVEIEESNKFNDCKVQYDGIKEGNEYIEYIAQCDIGLSTQVASGEYLKFSFPSKILSYMGLGLRVISSRIDCVQRSSIGELVFYYDKDDPEFIANTIMKVDMSQPYNSKDLIKKLDTEFVNSIKEMLEN